MQHHFPHVHTSDADSNGMQSHCTLTVLLGTFLLTIIVILDLCWTFVNWKLKTLHNHSWLRIQGLSTSVATQNWLSTEQLPNPKTTSNTTDKVDRVPGWNSRVKLPRRKESHGSPTKFLLKRSAIIRMLVPSLLHASFYTWAVTSWKAAPSHTGSAAITPMPQKEMHLCAFWC